MLRQRQMHGDVIGAQMLAVGRPGRRASMRLLQGMRPVGHYVFRDSNGEVPKVSSPWSRTVPKQSAIVPGPLCATTASAQHRSSPGCEAF